VKADRLPQFGQPGGVLLSVLLLLGQRRRRAIAVGRARLDEQLLLGVELIGQNLASNSVPPALRIGVDPGKSSRGRRCRASGRPWARTAVHTRNVEIRGIARGSDALEHSAFDDGRLVRATGILSSRCYRS
jgi:hypothetical protein